jgi:hypothetical protein
MKFGTLNGDFYVLGSFGFDRISGFDTARGRRRTIPILATVWFTMMNLMYNGRFADGVGGDNDYRPLA